MLTTSGRGAIVCVKSMPILTMSVHLGLFLGVLAVCLDTLRKGTPDTSKFVDGILGTPRAFLMVVGYYMALFMVGLTLNLAYRMVPSLDSSPAGAALTVGVGALIVFATFRFLMLSPACLVDAEGPVDAMVSSFNLLDGHVFRAFAVALIMVGLGLPTLLPFFITEGFVKSLQTEADWRFVSALGVLARGLYAPVAAMFIGSLYLALKTRAD